MASFVQFRLSDLSDLTTLPLDAMRRQDREIWRAAWHHLKAQPRKPADYSEDETSLTVWSFDGSASLRADELPSETALGTCLREFCLALARKRVTLKEPRPSEYFKHLDEHGLSADLAETESWEYVMNAVLARGAMPEGLLFMDGNGYATTNWIKPGSLRMLLKLEAEDGLLARMREEAASPAADFETILSLCDEALRENCDLYFFEPGT